jgi:sulfite reductase (NADPH) flavoprotein alpha-component
MAKDVHATLIAIIQKAGGRDEEDARDYLQTLQRDGRYRRDVY